MVCPVIFSCSVPARLASVGLAGDFVIVISLQQLIVAAGFGFFGGGDLFRDGRVTLHFGHARTAQCFEITFLVAHVLDHERVNAQAHIRQIAGGDFLHALRELIPLAVDFLHRQRADDAAQVAGQCLVRHVDNFLARLGEEPFGGRADRYIIAGDLDLGHAFERDGHALFGVDILGGDLDRHDFEHDPIDPFQHRPDKGAATLHDAVGLNLAGPRVAPLPAGDHQDFVRPNLLHAAGINRHQREHHKQEQQNDDGERGFHGSNSFLVE